METRSATVAGVPPRDGRCGNDARDGESDPIQAPAESEGPPPAAPGSELVPGYRVVTLLRRGADLDVYDLWSDERGCRCVGKIVRPDRVERRVSERLRREGRLLLRLSHPHLVRAYDVTPGDPPMVVLETLAGETLSHLIRRRTRLKTLETAHLGLHLCSALAYLHRNGVLHLDLKPSNVISSCGIGKLLDLSVARAPGRSRGGIGTPGYMAPEQISGGDLTPATDVWGLGALLFEAATGQEACPAPPDSPAGGIVPEWAPPSPVRSLRRLPQGLGPLIDRCLAEDPADRPPIEEVAQILTGVVLPSAR